MTVAVCLKKKKTLWEELPLDFFFWKLQNFWGDHRPCQSCRETQGCDSTWAQQIVVSLTEEWEIWDSPDTRGAQMQWTLWAVERSSHGGDEICRDGKIDSMSFLFFHGCSNLNTKNEVTFCLLLPWLFRCHRQVVSWNQQAFRPNPSLPQIDALDGVGSSSLSERSLFHRGSILNMAFAALASNDKGCEC